MVEVLIVGAGPAGTTAALVLARAGVRVLVVDRARFPRDKLCGDTVNPGTLAWLRALRLDDRIERESLALDGMMVTSRSGQAIVSDYGRGIRGRALPRRLLDLVLLEAAAHAGARVEQGARATEAILEHGTTVRGASILARGRRTRIPARVTIAADGRRSTLAFSLGLARQPAAPRRWAIGMYMTDVAGLSARGEMHLRPGHYVGIAPLPGGLANVCLVVTPRPGFGDPGALLRATLSADPILSERFVAARAASPVSCLGPLAVDASCAGMPGLLLAGDAAGFIDPMTGDGLRFAVQGGVLAAQAALEVLEHGRTDAHVRLARRRAEAFAAKQRFNRTLRALIGTRAGLGLGQLAARLTPSLVRSFIRRAGDIDLALHGAEKDTA